MRRLAYVLGKDDVDATTKTVEAVDDVARRFRDAGIDILALNGGDGTNHVTLTSFLRVYGDEPLPMVAFLRGGTMNTVSNAIGIRGEPQELLVNIVEKYYLKQSFEISERDLLKISDANGTAYGFIFGTGVISNYLSVYYDAGDPSPASAAKLVAQGLGSAVVQGPLIKRLFKPARGRLYANGEPWREGTFYSVAASTIDQIGLGFRPFVRCEAQPGEFHALAILCSPVRFCLMLPWLRTGRPLPQDHVPDTLAHTFVFESDEPIEYTIDGDLHQAGNRITIETGPRLQIIVK